MYECSYQQLVLARWPITVHPWKCWTSVNVSMLMIMPSKMCYKYAQQLYNYDTCTYIHTYINQHGILQYLKLIPYGNL